MASPAEDPWPYPKVWCPTCRRGFRAVEDLVDHQLSRHHWRPTPPEALCARLVAKAPAVDPAEARQLRAALAAAGARRREEARDGLS
jgi:hypothetical protein